MSDLVGNPEDRFSRVAAHNITIRVFAVCHGSMITQRQTRASDSRDGEGNTLLIAHVQYQGNKTDLTEKGNRNQIKQIIKTIVLGYFNTRI